MQLKYKGPVVLAILDGVGLRKDIVGNAVKQAHTEFLNMAVSQYPTIALRASGEAVGITAGTMGNSEVGHNTIGCGQIVKQGAAYIEDAFESGKIWDSQAWKDIVVRTTANHGTLHFAGIFSDGNVHSNIRHLEKMIERAHTQGIERIRVHLVLDGRDVPPQSATQYIAELEAFIDAFPDHPDYRIASGGGRMVFVADRYESDWNMVKVGWDAIVHGKAEHQFSSAIEAVGFFRAADANLQDQYIPPFVITENNQPVGCVKEGDSFIYYDFRADRALEIAQAFTYEDFPYFERGTDGNRRMDVYFAGLTEYNSDTHVPEHRLLEPISIDATLNRFVASRGLSQLAIAETVKFGHVTYYFNGNSYEKADGEEHIQIDSDNKPFDTRPWMKAAEITDAAIENLHKYDFVRINFAGGDMVGHFAELEPTIAAIEAIDIQLARLAKEVDRLGGVLLVTADHGNAEELVDPALGSSKTSHTSNPVPFIIYDNTENRQKYRVARLEDAGLSNIAATIALMLGQNNIPEAWRAPLIGD